MRFARLGEAVCVRGLERKFTRPVPLLRGVGGLLLLGMRLKVDTVGVAVGDFVKIRETRPLSKTKRWRVVGKTVRHS